MSAGLALNAVNLCAIYRLCFSSGASQHDFALDGFCCLLSLT